MSELTAVPAYTFAGGGAIGVAEAGFKIAGALEPVPIGVDAHERNVARRFKYSIWRTIREGLEYCSRCKVDAMLGAPPCHGFAMCNTSNPGIDHKDNVHMRNYAKLITKVKPTIGAFDMVPRFLTMGEPILKWMAELWARHGYATTIVKTDGWRVGMPQHRKRLMVIAHKVELVVPDVEWNDEKLLSVAHAIHDLRGADMTMERQEYPESKRITPYEERMRAGGKWLYDHGVPPKNNLEPIIKYMKRHELYGSLRRVFQNELNSDRKWTKTGSIPAFITQKVRWDAPSCCVTSNKLVHPDQVRYLTVREQSRLMSYPDWFRWGDIAYSECGKAVPPIMAQEAAAYIKRSIEHDEKISDPDGTWRLIDRTKRP